MDVDKSTVSHVVSDVTDAIVEISQRFIRWACEAAEKQKKQDWVLFSWRLSKCNRMY